MYNSMEKGEEIISTRRSLFSLENNTNLDSPNVRDKGTTTTLCMHSRNAGEAIPVLEPTPKSDVDGVLELMSRMSFKTKEEFIDYYKKYAK